MRTALADVLTGEGYRVLTAADGEQGLNRAMLRHIRRQTNVPDALVLGDVHIDLIKQSAVRGKKPLRLTAKEFAMLGLMAQEQGQPITRERFLDLVWGC